jgi:hypothetical protein
MEKLFVKFATLTAKIAGKPWTFIACSLIVLVWAATGPIFKFNETWQLVINTGTTIITFLMVFLIQNTQNRDGAAMQAKLDELVFAVRAGRRAVHRHRTPDREGTRRHPGRGRGAGTPSIGQARRRRFPDGAAAGRRDRAQSAGQGHAAERAGGPTPPGKERPRKASRVSDLVANAVGTAAALCSITSFAPQMIKIWKERDASSCR